MTKKLLLFDLDWTLIYTGGAGVRALNFAFEELFGIPDAMKKVSPDGKTDPAICREMIRVHQKRDAQLSEIKALCEKYLEQLTVEVPKSPGFRILPGIPELLEKLKKNPNVLLALGTGNLKRGAEIKLARPDFWKYFPVGGFADDSEVRIDVLSAAVRRGAKQAGHKFAVTDVVVIGDTVHDIHAGQAIGAQVIAVACGPTPAEILEAEKPDFLFKDLSDTNRVIEAMLR